MVEWRDHPSDAVREYAREAPMPDAFEPMLATLTDTPFSDEDWIFERKLDGIRLLVFRDGDSVRLMTRNGKARANHFPELVDACRAQSCTRFVLDGEVVAFKGRLTSFARLQERAGISDPDEARASGVAIHFYVFDCPWLDGADLVHVPLRERKNVLRAMLDFDNTLRYTPHRNAQGEAYLRQAYAKGWEGIIAKHAASRYGHGRSRHWLKLKCEHGQELVIGGFTDPQGERTGFGALLLGYYEHGSLRYAGRVGTGFDEATLEHMRAQLGALERDESPFADRVNEPGVHWVEPERVAEVRFTEWTGDGKLRHPRFIGERRDKDARDVERESPAKSTA